MKYDFNVPGGYSYVQPKTGMKFGGNEPFKAQCVLILTHRKANHLARATIEETAADLDAATCGRMPGVCFDSNSPRTAGVASGIVRTGRCGTCGGRTA